MPTQVSCIYAGSVRHRRFGARKHSFRQPLFMMYLDLEELPTLFASRWFWAAHRGSWAAFRREDHVGDPDRALDVSIRDLVEQRLGRRPLGSIRLLTHMAYGGHRFNPVSFYYCHSADGQIEAIVAEINNTPWNEQHCYVLDVPDGRLERTRFEFDKGFHVSPFMPMNQRYRWRFTRPEQRLAVHMVSLDEAGESVFDASLVLARKEITSLSLARVLLRHPLMTVHVTAAIYWQAFRLWRKGCPYFPHPRHTTTPDIKPGMPQP